MRFLRAIRDMVAAFRADREREDGDGWENAPTPDPLHDVVWGGADADEEDRP